MQEDGHQPGYQPRHAKPGAPARASRRSGGAGRHAAQPTRPRTIVPPTAAQDGSAAAASRPARRRHTEVTAMPTAPAAAPRPAGSRRRRRTSADAGPPPGATEIVLTPDAVAADAGPRPGRHARHSAPLARPHRRNRVIFAVILAVLAAPLMFLNQLPSGSDGGDDAVRASASGEPSTSSSS